MDLTTIGLIGLGLFLVLLALRCPISVAMSVIGLGGAIYLNGWNITIFVTGSLPFESAFPYGLSVVPLFVIMGSLALKTGMSRNLYDAGDAAFGHLPGGLSMGTIAACAGFGAICGSSLATSATMARISIPEMSARGYKDSFSAATVAAGGTLGVLIPPSIILVIYAILTEQSIGRLFVASLVPGILATVLYLVAIRVSVQINPQIAPVAQRNSRQERLRLLAGAWPVLGLFVVVLGGLFAGFFSPTEAASVGVIGTAVIAFLRGRLTRQALIETARDSASLTGMIFMILIGAGLFNYFVEATHLSRALVEFVENAGLENWQLIVCIILLYLVLGCFMDSVSMIFLTLPFVYPVVISHGLDPIWFGILLLSVVEIGLITPPVGMNLFVVKTAVPKLSMTALYRAILPFLLADFVRLTLVAAIPLLSLGLVSLIY